MFLVVIRYLIDFKPDDLGFSVWSLLTETIEEKVTKIH